MQKRDNFDNAKQNILTEQSPLGPCPNCMFSLPTVRGIHTDSRQGNHFELLTRLSERPLFKRRIQQHKRARARQIRRKELVDGQLAHLDTAFSTRIDDLIRANSPLSTVQLPNLDFSPMTMVKWTPSTLFLPPDIINSLQPAMSSAEALLLAASTPLPSMIAHANTQIREDDDFSSFVAAKLPDFHEPTALYPDITLDVKRANSQSLMYKPQPTGCVLYRGVDEADVHEQSHDAVMSLQILDKGRMPEPPHADMDTVESVKNEDMNTIDFVKNEDDWAYQPMSWPDQHVMDWPYDPPTHLPDEVAIDWDDGLVDSWPDEMLVVEPDEWTLVEPECYTFSGFGSAFSSVDFLPPPVEDKSAHNKYTRRLAEDDDHPRHISKSAWESDSDFCIPAFS
jgi:hypothetical protein